MTASWTACVVATCMCAALLPSGAAKAAVVVLAMAGVLCALAQLLAHVATAGPAWREGDSIDLADGRRGRVRAVRWGYSVLDAADGSTVIVRNSTLDQTSLAAA